MLLISILNRGDTRALRLKVTQVKFALNALISKIYNWILKHQPVTLSQMIGCPLNE